MTNEDPKRPFSLQWIPAGSVQTNPDQYVEHPDEQLTRLRALIFGKNAPGWAGATLINERVLNKGWLPQECGHYFIDGHARDQVAQEFDAEIPALIGQWTPAEEKQLIALINPLAMMAQIIPEKQLKLLESAVRLAEDPEIVAALHDLQYQAQAMIDAAYVEPLPADVDAEPQLERRDELQREWGTAPGQLWRLGSHLLLCGDSTQPDHVQRLMGDDRATLFSTDPPYLVGYDGTNHPQSWKMPESKRQAMNKDWSERGYKDWDDPEQGEELFVGFIQTAVSHAISDHAAWYCWHASVNRVMVEEVWVRFGAFVHQEIVWVKDRPILTRTWYMWQHEPCIFGWVRGNKPQRTADNHPTTIWSFPTVPAFEKTDHPTSKPVQLFEIPMLQHTRTGDLCYEPFAGSGSQIIAAERLGRVCRAIEINPAYTAVILQRYLDATGVRPELVS